MIKRPIIFEFFSGKRGEMSKQVKIVKNGPIIMEMPKRMRNQENKLFLNFFKGKRWRILKKSKIMIKKAKSMENKFSLSFSAKHRKNVEIGENDRKG
jgi:hypothetical protein